MVRFRAQFWGFEIGFGMYIEELKDAELGIGEEEVSNGKLGMIDAKRVVIGVGARVLFYPTLLYNVIRNKMEAEFHWWDEVDQV